MILSVHIKDHPQHGCVSTWLHPPSPSLGFLICALLSMFSVPCSGLGEAVRFAFYVWRFVSIFDILMSDLGVYLSCLCICDAFFLPPAGLSRVLLIQSSSVSGVLRHATPRPSFDVQSCPVLTILVRDRDTPPGAQMCVPFYTS